MPRPHIEFIQAQALPWGTNSYPEFRPGTETKVLSADSDDGECSVLIRYPAGWKQDAGEHLLVHEEIFVLDGTIEIAGVEYGRNFYAYLPAGYERPSASSKDGAVVLTFFSGTPRADRGEPANGLYDDALLLKSLDTINMPFDNRPFDREMDPLISQGRNKTLRKDPYTDGWTFLFGSFAQSYPEGWAGKLETHECVEEFYLLAGELHAGNCGVMQPGAYFWRPPHIEHGPYGTIGGYFAFFRCIHGPMYNIWSDHKVDFGYYPPYKPAVPPELEQYVKDPMAGVSNY